MRNIERYEKDVKNYLSRKSEELRSGFDNLEKLMMNTIDQMNNNTDVFKEVTEIKESLMKNSKQKSRIEKLMNKFLKNRENQNQRIRENFCRRNG